MSPFSVKTYSDCVVFVLLQLEESYRTRRVMSIVSIASIAAFFEGEAKQISRGENAYQSHRVESFFFNSMAAHISAKVGASMKSRVYAVEVSFFPDKNCLCL